MTLDELKRRKAALFQAANEKDASLIFDYLADEIIWHDGCAGENGEDTVFTVTKEQFIQGNVLGTGAFQKTKKINFQIAEKDTVSTYFTVEGIHVDAFMGYQATGKKCPL